MSDHPVRLRRIASFMRIAREDLRAAHVLAATARSQAMFFAQQAVEKLLRAVIEGADRRAGPTHNIGELAMLLTSSHTMYDMFLKFNDLSGASTRYRYPTSSGHVFEPPPEAELATRLADIENLASNVARHLQELNLYRPE